ncbi:LOW QUALITY PROTEIN: epoxide hydrolase 1-like [Amphiura filiformis]|uniref:LOW QUALITY PROTEIN: epoxide hydrolase 1-like n=1 Tax=Amphiura filiformis TaxID=82378 RepID=UPI003B21945E
MSFLGMNAHVVARIFGKLMSRLGHDIYCVQGGDWCSTITTFMGLLLPEHVKGLHINMVVDVNPPIQLIIGSYFPSLFLPANHDHHRVSVYNLEKFSNVTRLDSEDGGLNDEWLLDDLLNNVMVYWINGNMASAMRFYKENMPLSVDDINKCQIKVPSGIADFPGEMLNQPETWARYKYINLLQYNSMPRGGHFAALEEPQLLTEDIRIFIRKVETLYK